MEKSTNIPDLVDGGYCFEPQCWDGWLDFTPFPSQVNSAEFCNMIKTNI